MIDGTGDNSFPTGINTSTISNRDGGEVTLDAGIVRIISGGTIATDGITPVRGGPITINCDQFTLDNGTLSSTGELSGSPGAIILRAKEAFLTNGAMINTSSSFTQGGRISIAVTQGVTGNNATISATAANNGGEITIRSGRSAGLPVLAFLLRAPGSDRVLLEAE